MKLSHLMGILSKLSSMTEGSDPEVCITDVRMNVISKDISVYGAHYLFDKKDMVTPIIGIECRDTLIEHDKVTKIKKPFEV